MIRTPARFHGRLRRLLVAGIALIPIVPAWAASSPPIDLLSLRAHSVKQWSKNEGLPAHSVETVVQTREGYLWLGLDEGLVRFDGTRFTFFDAESTPELRDSRILSLSSGPKDRLWIGTAAGLTSLRNGVFRAHSLPGAQGDDRVVALFVSRGGVLWVGTGRGLFVSADGIRFERFSKTLEGTAIRAIAEDAAGTIWVGTEDRGLFRCAGGSCERLDLEDLGSVRALHPSRKGGMWVGTRTAGLFRIDGLSVERWTRENGLVSNSVYALLEAQDGSLWIGTNGQGVMRLRGGKLETPRAGAGPLFPRRILQARRGDIWIAGVDGGISRFALAQFRMLNSADGLAGDIALPIYESPRGDLWVGTAGKGLSRFHGGKWSTYDTSSGLRSNVVLTVYGDRDGDIWVGTAGGGLARFDGNRFSHVTSADGLASDIVTAVLPARDGALWIATGGGILHRRIGGRIARVDQVSLQSNINTLFEASDGSLWIGTEADGIGRLVGGRFVSYRKSAGGLSSDTVSAFWEDQDKAIWIGTAGGLNRWKDGRFSAITKSHGLRENLVQQVLYDGRGYLWLGGNHGISRIGLKELREVANGRTQRVEPVTFGTSHGLETSETNGGIFPAAWRASNGLLYFATMAGVAITDPSVQFPATTLQPLIEEVRTSRGAISPLQPELRLPPRNERLEIVYSAPAFTDPDATHFRYRLDGFDSGWVNAGTRRLAQYTRIPPGNYTFRVVARRPHGEWSPREAVLRIDVAPALFEMRAFKAGLAVLLMLLIFFAHRWRTRALRRRHTALELLMEERARGQESLRQSESHFRMLIENASDLVMIVSLQGRILYVSPSASRVLGRPAEDLIDLDLRSLVRADDVPLLEHSLFENLAEGQLATALIRIPSAAMQERHLELVAQRLEFDDQHDRILINCRDVTSRKALEQRLEQATRVASLGRLATTIAHEFNNVLMSVGTMAAVIHRAEPSSPRTSDLSQKILDSVARGKRITDDILRFARNTEPDIAPVPLTEYSAQLLAELRELLGSGIDLEVATCEPGLSVAADAQQLTQMFTNLALNAKDAMPAGGALSIRFRRADESDLEGVRLGVDSIHVTVADNGSGIPPEVISHIFEPLYTTKRNRGNGIGLAVVHQIILKHGGHVSVQSEVGKGTTFHIFLPSGSSEERDDRPDTTQESGTRGLRVLLVEDDPLVSDGIRANLEMHGVTVEAVMTGAAALESVARSRPDGVLLDVDLPDLPGGEVCERLEQLAPGLPIIFSTGHADVTLLQTCLDRESVSFLRKPYEVTDAIRELQKLIARATPPDRS
jgi:PAS domain S-box-containing protein